MAVRLLMGKRNKARNGYRMHDYNNGDGSGYRESYSDDEDDVFVEEVTSDGLAGMSKPLMHPRHRTKVKSRHPECRCRSLCKPVLYFLLIVTVLGGLVSLILYAFNRHTHFLQSGASTQSGGESGSGGGASPDVTPELIGCDRVEVEDVWVAGFPKLLTESAFRLVDVNQDGVLDVILGFATGADGYMIPSIVCDVYFNGTLPCFGGLLALEGLTGRELWRHYSYHELFALNCNVDLDGDGVKDCLGGGRAAALEAVSGKQGSLLWRFEDEEMTNKFSNVYTPQYVSDLNGDHVPDVLIVHGGDPFRQPHSQTKEQARIALMSGRTGKVLRWMVVPEGKESYSSPQVYPQQDGTMVVLFGTGGETHGGSLWVITLDHLKEGKIELARAVYTDTQKGVMTPPVLVDLTGDGTVDIVMNPFNSTVIALDGRTFDLLWNRTFPSSESYSTPAAGFYNGDDIPDFLVNWAFGPGYPVYYHAETTVLDGRTGEPLISPSVQSSVGAQTSALTVSMEGKGHDLFLYWLADCLGHEGEGGEYHFVNGTNVHEQSRSDFCQLRFQTKLYTRLQVMSSAIPPPGTTVYYSEDRGKVEHQYWVNTTAEALEFLHNHPDMEKEVMERWKQRNLELEQLALLGKPKEDYLLQQPLMGDYSASKKGASLLQPDRRLRPLLPQQYQTSAASAAVDPQRRRPSSGHRTPQQQQQQRQGQQFDKYNFYPFQNSYGVKDEDDGVYTSGAQSGGGVAADADFEGQGSYPYNPDQRHEYPGYYSSDRYRMPGSGSGSGYQGDGYQPYNNYFQKRNLDDLDPAELLDGLGEMDDGSDRAVGLKAAIREALLSRQGVDGGEDRGEEEEVEEEGAGGWGDDSQSEVRNPLDVAGGRALTQGAAVDPSGEGKFPRVGGAFGGDGPLPHAGHTLGPNSGRTPPQDKTPGVPQHGDDDNVRSEQTTPPLSTPGSVSGGKTTRRNKEKPHSNGAKHAGDEDSGNADTKQNDMSKEVKSKIATAEGAAAAAETGSKYLQNQHTRDDIPSQAKEKKNIRTRTPPNLENTNKKSGIQKAPKPKNNSNSKTSGTRKPPTLKKRNNKNSSTRKPPTLKTKNKNSNSWAQKPPPKLNFMKKRRRRRRRRRHVGPHDGNGLQRLLSTGTLAPSSLPEDHPDYAHTVDLLFATYWFFPAKTRALLPRDQDCIDRMMAKEKQRFDPKNQYYGMDHDLYSHEVTELCLKQSQHQLSEQGVYESLSSYDPFNVHMGQMTVYRLRVKCTCSQVTNTTTDKRCARVLPFDRQRWPAYMGRHGDSFWFGDT